MLIWILFIAFILIFLLLDLGVFHKENHIIKTKEAAIWTVIWVSIALGFSVVIYLLFYNGLVDNPTGLSPINAAVKYVTGYLIELTLSVDNIFVIAVIFSSFKIPLVYQHSVLFWGILGAVVFRAIMIFFGVALITRFEWVIYIFGIFLIVTAFKMLKEEEENFNPKKSFVFKQIRKIYPITASVQGNEFFINRMGIKAATPLFVALVVIELTDILFALDSIPAILAITANPFIVFSSNILAIMGLRSMYFLISRMLEKFKYINYSLAIILAFVGLKMLFTHQLHIPEWISLVVIFGALLSGIVASLTIKENNSVDNS